MPSNSNSPTNSPLRPPGPHLPLELQADYVGIEKATDVDVLCGRGVTTNRHPGNAKFRSLIGCNKELYVTSTKKQKMGISRSIVEAVRGLGGRFLEKDTETGLYYDIGDKKAVEKCSQALRDGAAALRKQLSDDLNDPDFLNAVFDTDDVVLPPAPTKSQNKSTTKKGHRRTKSNPVPVSHSREAIMARRRSGHPGVVVSPKEEEPIMTPSNIFNEGFELSAGFDDLLPPLPTPPPARRHHRSHRRVHSSTSAPVFGGFSGQYGGGDPQAPHPLFADEQPWMQPQGSAEPMSSPVPSHYHHGAYEQQQSPTFDQHPLLMDEPPTTIPIDGTTTTDLNLTPPLRAAFDEDESDQHESHPLYGGSDPVLRSIMQEPILEMPLTEVLSREDGSDLTQMRLSDVQRGFSSAALLAEDEPTVSTTISDDNNDNNNGVSSNNMEGVIMAL